ncbi:hypothetical protein [Micromonospora sp. NPDC049679]|uniref:hypothetical protein n=1 Tax=Micromonospora sp. NPDC049679 TaxID=3155920 RepID=UPI0033DB84AC
MRDLDDALARLARRDQLQKRNSNGHHDEPRPAVDEVAEALRQVIERHPGLSAVVRLDGVGASTEIRVSREAGTVRVTTTDLESTPSPTSAPPLDPSPLAASPLDSPLLRSSPLDPHPLDASPGDPSPHEAEPLDPQPLDGFAMTGSPLPPRPRRADRLSAYPVPSRPLDSEPFPADATFPTSDAGPADTVSPIDTAFPAHAAADPIDRQPALPPAAPPEWPLRAEAAPGSPEARLAELVRRDPSLLEHPREG